MHTVFVSELLKTQKMQKMHIQNKMQKLRYGRVCIVLARHHLDPRWPWFNLFFLCRRILATAATRWGVTRERRHETKAN